MTQDEKVSAAIMNIRVSAGGSSSKCSTCGKSPEAPSRRIVGGEIVEGCIDATHTGRLATTTNTAYWHNRSSAKAIRANTLQWLRSL